MANPDLPSPNSTKFFDMSFTRKLAFTAKFAVFLITLGFAFSHVMEE
jgi:hypothetical protein